MAKKTGKLTKIEKFYIENNSEKDADEMATDLNRTKSAVSKHIKSMHDTGHVSEAKDPSSQVGDLMGHKDSRGVTIMTPAASQLSDETKSKSKSASRHENAIHIIKKK
tara:strand:+ start:1832 stop:2155 length:324 start_codon:yes stop_codon:yes gene_type:complete